MNAPTLTVLAGPNGSGKSTLKRCLVEQEIGIHVNPDELLLMAANRGKIPFSEFDLEVDESEVLAFFRGSLFLENCGFGREASLLRCEGNSLVLEGTCLNAYFASVAADFIRRCLLRKKRIISFETVMSSPDKLDFLAAAQRSGYVIRLYFVCTRSPEINLIRVKNRVALGGHHVPEEKIVSRYHRSLRLLPRAMRLADITFLYDNSGPQLALVAHVSGTSHVHFYSDKCPSWVDGALRACMGDLQ